MVGSFCDLVKFSYLVLVRFRTQRRRLVNRRPLVKDDKKRNPAEYCCIICFGEGGRA